MKLRRIEHLGIAVRDVEKALAVWHGLLDLPVTDREVLEDLKLKVAKVGVGESVLELLEPLPGEEVISKFLESRGEGLHHVCFEVDDVAAATEEIRAKGYDPVWPAPRRGAGGRWVNFLRPKQTGGVLVELNGPPVT